VVVGTTGGHVGFESWLERDHLVALDYVSCAGMEGWPFVKSAGTAALADELRAMGLVPAHTAPRPVREL
jgi:hypothetical protein